MWRGEIRLVDFEPSQGSEANKVRPAVVVSNDGANAAAANSGGRGVVTVVPLTTNVAKVYPFQVLLDRARCGLREDSKAQTEQVRAIAAGRIGMRIGRVPPDLLKAVDQALRLHLAL